MMGVKQTWMGEKFTEGMLSRFFFFKRREGRTDWKKNLHRKVPFLNFILEKQRYISSSFRRHCVLVGIWMWFRCRPDAEILNVSSKSNTMRTIHCFFFITLFLFAYRLNAQSPAQNKEAATNILRAVDAGDVNAFGKYVSPNIKEHMPFPPDIGEGKSDFERTKMMIASIHTSFPDSKTVIEKMVAEGDMVMLYSTWTGTNKGTFMGMPATNKSLNVKQVEIIRFDASGKAVEHWSLSDDLTMMIQLGLIPDK
jgi:steroid delta-isomerase-like uncharacterized protein